MNKIKLVVLGLTIFSTINNQANLTINLNQEDHPITTTVNSSTPNKIDFFSAIQNLKLLIAQFVDEQNYPDMSLNDLCDGLVKLIDQLEDEQIPQTLKE